MQYIFDMDGTLIDSMPSFGGAILRYLEENGIAYPPNVVDTVTPLGFLGTAEYFINTLGVSATVEDVARGLGELMLDAYFHKIPAKEDVIETLIRLRAEGHSLHILTASPHVTMDPCLARLGILPLVDNAWSSDDFGMIKAKPEIYRAVAKRLDVSVEDCIFFDDNLGAITAARAAGMHTVGVYDESGKHAEEQMKQTAERYIYRFSEI